MTQCDDLFRDKDTIKVEFEKLVSETSSALLTYAPGPVGALHVSAP